MLDYPLSDQDYVGGKLLKIVKIAIPSMMTFFFQFLSELINIYFIGHLNDAHMLAGSGMGNIIISMMVLAVFLGMNGALETFIS